MAKEAAGVAKSSAKTSEMSIEVGKSAMRAFGKECQEGERAMGEVA